MSNLVFVTGDFCSGSTLLFTLFRKTGQYCCLYEPLHEKLREYLVYGPRAERQDHHFFMEDDYYDEFRGFRDASALFDPAWGAGDLVLAPDAPADALYRYLSYLVGTAFARTPRVLLKENRMPFRLAWFKANFPHARIVHIYRKQEDQWRSIVRRAQGSLGREDVGQDRVDFAGFNIARWCDALAPHFPELAATESKSGEERFAKLWARSYEFNRASADVSVGYHELLNDFEATWARISEAIGMGPTSATFLKQFVVTPDKQGDMIAAGYGESGPLGLVADGVRRRYARLRARLDDRRFTTESR
jgi:hypothetical protein